jgi:hypothetical protein
MSTVVCKYYMSRESIVDLFKLFEEGEIKGDVRQQAGK